MSRTDPAALELPVPHTAVPVAVPAPRVHPHESLPTSRTELMEHLWEKYPRIVPVPHGRHCACRACAFTRVAFPGALPLGGAR